MSADKDFLSSEEAAQWLQVRRQTLYAYVSRGLVRSVQAPHSRQRLYAREDLERLHQRAQVRDGQAAVAANALNLGHPIVVTSITEITPRGPSYRGRLAVDLAEQGACFEQVAELLWSGLWHEEPFAWQAEPAKVVVDGWGAAITPAIARDQLAELFAAAVLQLGMGRGTVRSRLLHGRPLEAARELVLTLAGCAGFLSGQAYRPAAAQTPLAAALLQAWGRPVRPQDERLLNATLVLLADHELSPGTFSARIAASGGSALHACLAAALAASSGTEVTRRYERVEAFLQGLSDAAQARLQVRERAAAGLAIPGFEHPLYPLGDPRAHWLLQRLGQRRLPVPAARTLAFIEDVQQRQGLRARHELAVIVTCQALRLPPGSAAALFLVARMAGWVAHVLEQRLSPALIRPRAKFVSRREAGVAE